MRVEKNSPPDDPFAPPAAAPFSDVVSQPRHAETRTVARFRQQSVWLLLLLTIITGGIYIVSWLHRQVKVINRALPEEAIDIEWVVTTYVLWIGSLALMLVSEFAGTNQTVSTLNSFFNIAGNLSLVFLTFKVRNRIHSLLASTYGESSWFSSLWTLLLSVYYLQGKLNKLAR